MSKKKKFAGKKTKLAELALTQALAKHPTPFAPSPDTPSLNSSLSQVVQALRDRQMELDLPFTPDPGAAALPHPLDYSYEQLRQDLQNIRDLLCPVGMSTTRPKFIPPGVGVSDRRIIRELGRITLETLREIKIFLG